MIQAMDKPKRPLSAYNLFFQSERKQLLLTRPVRPEGVPRRRGHGKIGFAEMARTIAGNWNTIDPEIKAKFEALAKIEKVQYRKKLAEWKQLIGSTKNKSAGSKKNKSSNKKKSKGSAKNGNRKPHEEEGESNVVVVSSRMSSADTEIDVPFLQQGDEEEGHYHLSLSQTSVLLNESMSSIVLDQQDDLLGAGPTSMMMMDEEQQQEQQAQEPLYNSNDIGPSSAAASCHQRQEEASWLMHQTRGGEEEEEHFEFNNSNSSTSGGQGYAVIPVSAFQVKPSSEVIQCGIETLAQKLDAESIDFFINCFTDENDDSDIMMKSANIDEDGGDELLSIDGGVLCQL